jgi:hypothetical protein
MARNIVVQFTGTPDAGYDDRLRRVEVQGIERAHYGLEDNTVAAAFTPEVRHRRSVQESALACHLDTSLMP